MGADAQPIPRRVVRSRVRALNNAEKRDPGLSALEYGLLVLVLAQVFLLGTSNELGPTKIMYGALFFSFYLVWGIPALMNLQGYTNQPVFWWTIVLLVMCAASRFVGMAHRIATIDWIRELSALAGYSWVFFLPLALRSGKSPRKLYIALLWIIGVLSIGNAIEFKQLREVGVAGIHSAFLLALDAIAGAPLFGFFMAAGLAMGEEAGKRGKFIALETAFFLAALLSGTRTTLIAITVGVVFYCWLLRKKRVKGDYKRRVLALSAPLLAGAALFAVAVVSGVVSKQVIEDRIAEAMQGTEAATIINRLNEAHDAWQAFSQHPILGQGLGYKLGTVFVIGADLRPQDDFYVHDFYLYVLSKFGLVGFVVFGGLILAIFKTAIGGFKRSSIPFEQGLFGSTAALTAAMLVESITANLFDNRASAGILAIIAGMAAVSYKKYNSGRQLGRKERMPRSQRTEGKRS